jgi:hypothetical protein
MTAANILIYLALIGYILYLRVQGRPVKAGRRLFVLPVALVVIGFADVTQGASVKPIEVVLTVIAAAVSLGLGLLRGRADRLTERDGAPFVQWTAVSLALFFANLAAKLVLDLIGVAAGSSSSAAEKSLLFTLGLTLLGEAIVLRLRTGTVAPDAAWSVSRSPIRPVRPPATPAATGTGVPVPSVGDALARPYADHRARRTARHARRRARRA